MKQVLDKTFPILIFGLTLFITGCGTLSQHQKKEAENKTQTSIKKNKGPIETAKKLPSTAKIEDSEKRGISLQFSNESLEKVLPIIADNIYLNEDVDPNTLASLNVTDASVEDTLKALLKPIGLSFKKTNDGFMIGKQPISIGKNKKGYVYKIDDIFLVLSESDIVDGCEVTEGGLDCGDETKKRYSQKIKSVEEMIFQAVREQKHLYQESLKIREELESRLTEKEKQLEESALKLDQLSVLHSKAEKGSELNQELALKLQTQEKRIEESNGMIEALTNQLKEVEKLRQENQKLALKLKTQDNLLQEKDHQVKGLKGRLHWANKLSKSYKTLVEELQKPKTNDPEYLNKIESLNKRIKINQKQSKLYKKSVLKMPPTENETLYVVKTRMANVREQAGLSTIIMVLKKGEPVRIIGRKGKWTRIKAHNKFGWIFSNLLTKKK